MSRGDVYWVDFGPSLGGEITKTRPAIVLTTDRAARHLNRLQVVPLTSNTDRVFAGETLVSINGRMSKALATQLTTVSKQRIREQAGSLSAGDLALVESAVKTLLELT
jgi:mRNA interferase MazF